MAELKTKPTKASVKAFIDSIEDGQKRADARKIASMMRRATGARAKLWGASIVGYGSYKYTNSKGEDFEWMLTGYSPRKQALSIYIMPGFATFERLMSKLGKYKTGKSCLYIRRLSDVDEKVLEQLIGRSVQHMRKKYETR
jgi:hypothetical protein